MYKPTPELNAYIKSYFYDIVDTIIEQESTSSYNEVIYHLAMYTDFHLKHGEATQEALMYRRGEVNMTNEQAMQFSQTMSHMEVLNRYIIESIRYTKRASVLLASIEL